jgi:hypothetical protein
MDSDKYYKYMYEKPTHGISVQVAHELTQAYIHPLHRITLLRLWDYTVFAKCLVCLSGPSGNWGLVSIPT